jgi:uroporphyrinogen decarboxylase
VEYLVDEAVMKPIVTDLLGRQWVDPQFGGGSRHTVAAYLGNFIEFWFRLGYDIVRFETDMGFQKNVLETPDTALGSTRPRPWANEHRGTITSWEDFETYPWPRLEETDFFPYEYVDRHLPDGMGFAACHAGGIYEHLSWIMSYEGLCLNLYDNPELVQAVSEKIGSLLIGFYRHLLDLERMVAIFPGDDMGFKTGTLVSPETLRRFCLPWHKRISAMVHEKKLPYFLHSCGNLESIMPYLIEEVGIDGKHSFEDAILPVEEFQLRYGGEIAVLGGLDINVLSLASPEQVRGRTRHLMEVCGHRGRYAVGSGNSIPSYIPVDNYLAMVDEAVNFYKTK